MSVARGTTVWKYKGEDARDAKQRPQSVLHVVQDDDMIGI